MLTIILTFSGAIVAAGLLAAWSMMATNNRLVALDARCDTAFADVDAHLKHRANLIPGLVETVRGCANHEHDILLGITEARAQALAATSPELKLRAERNVSANISSLIAMADRLPDLKASQQFTALREELVDAENRITASRRFFNLATEEYNSTLRQFPGSYLAHLKHLSTRHPFDLGIERVLLDEPVAIKF